MKDFDALNRATRDFNSRNINRFNPSTRKNYTLTTNHYNAQTYKQHNDQHSEYYTKRHN